VREKKRTGSGGFRLTRSQRENGSTAKPIQAGYGLGTWGKVEEGTRTGSRKGQGARHSKART
jgi:hypothetical protein